MIRIIYLLCLCVLLVPAISVAGGVGEASQMVCSAVDVVECDSEGECVFTDSKAINLPQFIKVDINNQKLSDATAKGNGKETTIRFMEQTERKIILQGFENKRGWTVIVSKESGDFSATISEEDYGVIIFGTCLALSM